METLPLFSKVLIYATAIMLIFGVPIGFVWLYKQEMGEDGNTDVPEQDDAVERVA